MTSGSGAAFAERRRAWVGWLRPVAAAGILAFGLALVGIAAPAAALEPISISPATAEADGACPALTRIKYPWSNCGEGFTLGFQEGRDGEPPPSQCRLYIRDGICAATTQPWTAFYAGIVPKL